MIEHKNIQEFRKFNRLFIKKLHLHLRDTALLRVAAALSYTSLIAVVPLISIALAIFAAFPMFADVRAQVQEFLIQYFVPDLGPNLQKYMTEFVGAAAKLTTLGVIGIAVTAVLMLSTIENSFNFIFKVKKHRRLATKITMYWTILTLSPLLLGAVFSLKGYMLTLRYFSDDVAQGWWLVGTVLVHAVLAFSFLFVAYVVVPNKKVRPFSAFWGAICAFILMSLLRYGFGYFLALNVTYKTLYGALATVPLLLIWMYSWWAVVLFGAVVAATMEELHTKKQLWK